MNKYFIQAYKSDNFNHLYVIPSRELKSERYMRIKKMILSIFLLASGISTTMSFIHAIGLLFFSFILW